MSSKGRLVLALCLGLVLLPGCGKTNPNAPASISGKITFKGAPVTAGTIQFRGAGLYSTSIHSDGSYSISELPDGLLAVAIETESANPNKEKKNITYGGKGREGSSADAYAQKMRDKGKIGATDNPNRGAYVQIPARYHDATKSGLQVTLKKGSNKQDFDLTD
jgi:hypothetical protein